MQKNRQDKFILSPIIAILQDTVNACIGIGKGIETHSLCEYVLQTTFLKMTGTSEQKLKSICWEMATNDYDYRYHYLKKNYGECSAYADKNSIYKDIVRAIVCMDSTFKVDSLFEDVDLTAKEVKDFMIRETIIKQERQKNRRLTDEEMAKLTAGINASYTKNGLSDKEKWHLNRVVLFEEIQSKIKNIINDSLVALWEQHNYKDYLMNWKNLSNIDFAEGDVLLCKELQDFYAEIVYAHRNRCAHNLVSLQNNLPTLKTISEDRFMYDNYFFRFSILTLLDEIFIRLYRKYAELIESSKM